MMWGMSVCLLVASSQKKDAGSRAILLWDPVSPKGPILGGSKASKSNPPSARWWLFQLFLGTFRTRRFGVPMIQFDGAHMFLKWVGEKPPPNVPNLGGSRASGLNQTCQKNMAVFSEEPG